MKLILIILALTSSSFCQSLYMSEPHPKSGLTSLNKSQLNLKGDIKKVNISGFSIIERRKHKFIKISPSINYEFTKNGNIVSIITDGEIKTEKVYSYENDLINHYTESRSNSNGNESNNSTIRRISTDFHYKDGNIYGLISKDGNNSGCAKFTHSKNTIERIDCSTNNKVIHNYYDNGKLESTHTFTKIIDFKNTYTYKPNKVIIEKTVKNVVKSVTVISKDNHGNITEIVTNFLDSENSMSIIPINHLSNVVTYNILKKDKFGNPLETLITSTDIYEDTSKNTQKERKEFIKYEYYN